MSDRSENPLEYVTTWATTTTTQDLSTGIEDGRVQVQADGENVQGKVEQLGLPGHYAVATTGVDGLLLRLERGGWMVAAWTQPPSDAVTGEAGINVGGTVVRVLPVAGTVEIKGAPIVGGISLGAIDGSDLGPAPPGPLPLGVGVPGTRYSVARSGDLVQLGSTPIGNVIASTQRTVAS